MADRHVHDNTIQPGAADLERFAARRLEQEAGCWKYPGGSRKPSGHIFVNIRRPHSRFRNLGLHIVAYVAKNGPVPQGKEVSHDCRNPWCFNPDHLQARTRREHFHYDHAAVTHCKHGHEFTAENTYWYRGLRDCRACDRIRRNPSGRVSNRAKTHCPKGHAYSYENTYVNRAKRFCRTCLHIPQLTV